MILVYCEIRQEIDEQQAKMVRSRDILLGSSAITNPDLSKFRMCGVKRLKGKYVVAVCR
jgi:hypothetical protein